MTSFKTTKEEFLARFTPLLQEVKDLTPGAEAEQWLNTQYGVESELYQDLARLIRLGVQEGWAADTEIAGPRYRRSQLAAPSAETFFFGITIVLWTAPTIPRTILKTASGATITRIRMAS